MTSLALTLWMPSSTKVPFRCLWPKSNILSFIPMSVPRTSSSTSSIEFGEDFYQQWLAAINEVKLAQLTEKEKELVLSYSADIKGEKSYEGDTRLFGQIWFNAPS